MKIALSTGRSMEVSPLTVRECKQMVETFATPSQERTWDGDIAMLVTRLNICHQSIQRAGGQQTVEDLEELIVPEVEELFYAIYRLTLQETKAVQAFALMSDSGPGRPN